MNLRAAMVILGTSRSLLSSVIVETATTILSCPLRSRATFEMEIGGLLTLDEMSLLRTVLQKLESVLLVRNLKSYANNKLERVFVTYSDEEVQVEVLASSLLLVRICDSTRFDEINTL